MEKLVSVIVITYNSADYVVEALDSVLNQDYGNIELIITDDHSTDNTVNIIKDWIFKNKKRIDQISNFVLHQNDKNCGVSRNCNIGISLGNGDFYQILAGDDILMPNAITEKTKYAEDEDAQIVFSKIKVFGNENALFEIENANKVALNGYKMMQKSREEQYLALIENNFVVGPCGGFVRRSYIDKYGGYDERFPLIEDWPFVLKYVMNGFTIRLLNKELVKYRVTRHSLSNSNNKKYIKSVSDFLEYVRRDELIKNGKKDVINYQEAKFNEMLSDKKSGDRNLIYYHELYYWIYLNQQGRSIIDYFHKKNIKDIAIYGLGEMYRLVKRELINSDIHILYGIDNYVRELNDIKVFSPEDELPSADCIVVTTTSIFDKIKEKLKSHSSIQIVSLDDVIFEA